jgi:hypothetical protein
VVLRRDNFVRMPGTPRRGAGSGSGSSGRQAARPARRARKQAVRPQAQRFSWSRRVGVAAALLLLVGVGIAFAGNSLNGGGGRARSPEPEPTREAAVQTASPTPDTRPPAIHISRPDPGSTVYGATETLRGRTEAGASLVVTDEALGTAVDATVEPDGSFEAQLTLQLGENSFTLTSEDAAGNRASARLTVTRQTSLGSAIVAVSTEEINVADLPKTVTITAVVRDENNALSEGADVVFSVSPPNGSTETYAATTTNGEARWPQMVVSGDRRAIGKWLVTVLVTLPSGEELRDGAFFTVR